MNGRRCAVLVLCAATFASVGCAHHYYRAYDPSYHDYHVWNDQERVYYRQWAVETHRDPDRDFRKLHDDEQKQYWDWRHSHGDHDRDHDHDHDQH